MKLADVFYVRLNRAQATELDTESVRAEQKRITEAAKSVGLLTYPSRRSQRRTITAELCACGSKEILGQGTAVYNPNDAFNVDTPFNYEYGRQLALDRALEAFQEQRGIKAGLKALYIGEGKWDVLILRGKDQAALLSELSEADQAKLMNGLPF